jgi:hypothetical protein
LCRAVSRGQIRCPVERAARRALPDGERVAGVSGLGDADDVVVGVTQVDGDAERRVSVDHSVRFERGDVATRLGVSTVVQPERLLGEKDVADLALSSAVLSRLAEAEERRNGDGDEDCNDHHHNHELDEGEALIPLQTAANSLQHVENLLGLSCGSPVGDPRDLSPPQRRVLSGFAGRSGRGSRQLKPTERAAPRLYLPALGRQPSADT